MKKINSVHNGKKKAKKNDLYTNWLFLIYFLFFICFAIFILSFSAYVPSTPNSYSVYNYLFNWQ